MASAQTATILSVSRKRAGLGELSELPDEDLLYQSLGADRTLPRTVSKSWWADTDR
jgi:hypothetical protein